MARVLVAAFLLLFWMAGLAIAEPAAPPEPLFQPIHFNLDSLRLIEFDELSPDDQNELKKRARRARKTAAKAKSAPTRLQWLVQASDADPTDAGIWLDLAEQKRLMGYREEAATALASARAAFEREAGKKQKREHMRRYCLDRAWLDYDRGAFSDGKHWARQALKLDAGQAGHLIHLLNKSGDSTPQEKMESALRVFLPHDPNTNRPLNHKWVYLNWMHLGNIDWNSGMIFNYLKKRTISPEYNVTRWRDYGLISEANNDLQVARIFYNKSIEALPQSGRGWLIAKTCPTPGGESDEAVPFWVNQNQEYVTGSLLAYSAHAFQEMKRQTNRDDRLFWAERIIRGTTAAAPRYPFRPWTRLWRSIAFLELGRLAEAEDDQSQALAYFEEFEIDEPAINSLAGRIMLLEEAYPLAAPFLEQAVLDFPDDAGIWIDLGLVKFMQKQRQRARTAFDRALELDPHRTIAWHKRGLLNLHEGRFREAIGDLEQAMKLTPGNEELAEDLARAVQSNRRFEASRK